ncbi:MAG: asparagine synthase-related protein [Candidatus Helarchaeota archaeon]
MGLIAGIYSKNANDISEQLYKIATKLGHRGNSKYFLLIQGKNGWESLLCTNPEEILTIKTSFGIVARHLIIDNKNDEIPYAACDGKNCLMLDGRIFNFQQIYSELKESHSEISKNSGVIIHLIEELKKKQIEIAKIFEQIFNIAYGMFAAALVLDNKIFLFRDLIGIKPLYLHSSPNFLAFASEKKALWIAKLKKNIEPLLPGKAVQFTEKGFSSIYQAKFKVLDVQNFKFEYYSAKLFKILNDNLLKLLSNEQVYLLLSGGIDSSILAALLKKINANFKSLVIGSLESKDITAAQEVSDFLNLPLEILNFDLKDLEESLPNLIYSLESRDEKKLNIAFPLFYASHYVLNNNSRIIFTGQGADEIFGGYKRHELEFQKNPPSFQNMSWQDVKEMYKGNLQRDDSVAMANGIELRLPYLSKSFIEFAMQIPSSFKLLPPIRKYILRDVGNKLGLSEKIIQKRKKAIQFSSGSYSILKKLAKKYGFTKEFALKNGFFSPTQLFIDSISFILGFPDIDPKIINFVKKSPLNLPESVLKYKNVVNKIF